MHSTRINTRISLQISLNQSHLISIYIPTLPHVFLLFLLTHYTTSSNYHHTHILFISHTRIHGFKEEEGPEGLVISFGFCFTRQQGYKRVVFARGSTGSKESLVGCELILLLVLLFVFLSIKVYYLCLALFLFCSTMICIRKNVTKTKLWIKYILSHKMILRSAWNDDGKKKHFHWSCLWAVSNPSTLVWSFVTRLKPCICRHYFVLKIFEPVVA